MKGKKIKKKQETRNKKQDANASVNGDEAVDVNLKSEIKNQKSKEVDVDYKDRWMRARADYQNLVKEVENRRSEWAQMSERQIIEEFIPVYDNLAKALSTNIVDTNNTNDEKLNSWKKGVEFIKKQFEDVLKSHGVEEIKTVGEDFNPELHEAVGEEESEEFDEGVIAREVEAGYLMRGKLVRAAKVIIFK